MSAHRDSLLEPRTETDPDTSHGTIVQVLTNYIRRLNHQIYHSLVPGSTFGRYPTPGSLTPICYRKYKLWTGQSKCYSRPEVEWCRQSRSRQRRSDWTELEVDISESSCFHLNIFRSCCRNAEWLSLVTDCIIDVIQAIDNKTIPVSQIAIVSIVQATRA